MSKCNQAVRMAMRIHDVAQWQLAEAMDIREETLCRKLRSELPQEVQAEMIAKIMMIANKEKEEYS